MARSARAINALVSDNGSAASRGLVAQNAALMF